MAQAKRGAAETTEPGGYLREVADATKAGVDRATDYIEGMTEQTTGYVKDTMEQTREKLAEYRTRGVDRVWIDIIKFTKRKPERALLLAGVVGFVVGFLSRGER